MKATRLIIAAFAILMMAGCNGQSNGSQTSENQTENMENTTNTEQQLPIVYMTDDITPDALIRIYEALGVKAEGRVAVKISTGESQKSNHLRPELIKNLVQHVNGTIVECNTAYKGSRFSTSDHQRAIEQRGYNDIAEVDIMDAEGEMRLPVRDTTYMKYNIVGDHLANYDFMINLAHFKGHQMAGFGGVSLMRVIIPAAGKGSRLSNSPDAPPKVMYRIGGKPLLEIVLEQTSFIPPEDTWLVVGYKQEEVRAYFGNTMHYAVQKEQLGTGHAVTI